jgi:hypothetical protein
MRIYLAGHSALPENIWSMMKSLGGDYFFIIPKKDRFAKSENTKQPTR